MCFSELLGQYSSGELEEQTEALKNIKVSGVGPNLFLTIIKYIGNQPPVDPPRIKTMTVEEWAATYLEESIDTPRLKLVFDYLIKYHSDFLSNGVANLARRFS